jgi:hypothetical protein
MSNFAAKTKIIRKQRQNILVCLQSTIGNSLQYSTTILHLEKKGVNATETGTNNILCDN